MSWVTKTTAKPSRCCSSLIWLNQGALGNDVERRRGLVHDHELGREQKRHGDHRPLTHSPAELMWVAREMDRVDAHQPENLGRSLVDCLGRQARVSPHRVGELGLDALHRVRAFIALCITTE